MLILRITTRILQAHGVPGFQRRENALKARRIEIAEPVGSFG
jgi:hypothetical protein